jgi:hypothetical protein
MSRSAISYEPSLDGLRASAVLAVLVYHLDPRWLPGGFTGVDIFFVISSYLITRILLEQFDQGSFRLWSFYYRRSPGSCRRWRSSASRRSWPRASSTTPSTAVRPVWRS